MKDYPPNTPSTTPAVDPPSRPALEKRIQELEQERARLDTALQEARNRFDQLVNSLLDIVYEFDRNGQITFANRAAIETFVPPGGKPEDINFKNTMVETDRGPSGKTVAAILREGKTVVARRTFQRPDGSRFVGEVHSGPIFRGDEIVGVRGVLRDITERHRTEQKLRESEQRFRDLFDLSPQPVVVTEPASGRFVDVNLRFSEISGYSRKEALGKRSVDLGLYSTADRKRFVDALQQDGAVEGMEMEFRAKHGRRIPTLMFARLLKTGDRPLVLTVVTDLTEQKKLEAHLRQARKLEALGRLAGGIAHDFNNLLMAIQGNASLLVESYRDTEPRQTELENIQHAVQSGAKLVLQLLGFASAGTWNTETVDLKALVARTTEMFARTRKQIQISESYPTTPCVAEVDGEQIEQVILNLLINAAQAMQEGGKIEISLNETNLDASFVKPFDVAPARYVAIAIKDHGPGMDPATQQKVFEPFFTTKRPGGGTGLGLASAYGVVKRHGGFITVQSRPKSGSVFTVYLPASEGEPTAKSLPTELIKGHGETVLVVDDEAIIRRTTHAMLDGLGYRVLEANGGRQALEVLKNPPAPVDVVILDMIMPGMDGRQTAHRLKKRYPEIKVLISSGFSTALTARPNGATTDKPQHWDAVIAKPFTLSRLSQKLAALLDGTNHRD